MRRSTRVLSLMGVAVVTISTGVGSSALAAKPPKTQNALSITANPNPVVFGKTTAIGGQLTGSGSAGVVVTLETNPFPYAGFKKGPMTTTDATGRYFFSQAPMLNTQYQATARTKGGATTSPSVLELVRTRLTLNLGTNRPRRGSLVRFSGSVYPAHDGRLVAVQRRLATGAYRTIAQIRLTHVLDGSRSAYSKRLRIYRSGVLRTVLGSHPDHATGFSPRRNIRVR